MLHTGLPYTLHTVHSLIFSCSLRKSLFIGQYISLLIILYKGILWTETGDSKSTNKRGPSLIGSLGFSCRYKRFFYLPWLLWSAKYKIFFPHRKPVLRIHEILVRIRIRIRASMPLTNGSGSRFRKPKNIRIRRIRIRNTAVNYFNSFVPIAQQARQAVMQGHLSFSLCLFSSHLEKSEITQGLFSSGRQPRYFFVQAILPILILSL
jgi:hypothetical protein